jgi:UDP-N-acetylglucosamine 1-carboxyvinyltransferase
VRALDIRSGAAIILAGLAAEGETIIEDVHHVDRGYEDFVAILQGLGADITREPASAKLDPVAPVAPSLQSS